MEVSSIILFTRYSLLLTQNQPRVMRVGFLTLSFTRRPANCEVCLPWAQDYAPGDVVEPCLRRLLCMIRARRTKAGHKSNRDDFFPTPEMREKLVHLTTTYRQASRTSTPLHQTSSE